MLGIERSRTQNKKLTTLYTGEGTKPVDLLRLNNSGPILAGKEAVILKTLIQGFDNEVGKDVSLKAASVRRAINGGFCAEIGIVRALKNPKHKDRKGFLQARMTDVYMLNIHFVALRVLAGAVPEVPRDLYVFYDYHPSRLSGFGNRLRQALNIG